MYSLMQIILAVLTLVLLFRGIRGKRAGSIVAGIILGLLSLTLFAGMRLWSEALWFHAAGYAARFWKVFGTKIAMGIVSAIAAGAVLYALVFSLPRNRRWIRWTVAGIGALSGAVWGVSHWLTWLRFIERVPGEIRDPALGMTVGFYLFTLPFIDAVYGLALWLIIVAVAALAISLFVRREGDEITFRGAEAPGVGSFRSLYLAGGLLLVILAFGRYLARFHLLYSEWGVVHGPGWTDMHVRLPMFWISMVVTALLAISLFIPPIRRRVVPAAVRRRWRRFPRPAVDIGSHIVFMLLVWLVLLSIVPSLVQWLRVEPNEITLETPYIGRNIEMTRRGFGLEKVEEREFPVEGAFDRQLVDENSELLKNVRLWDYRALEAVFKQFQEIRLYYEFADVDIDRYHLRSGYRQVMISAREMELDNLPPKSQTFVNRRFKYTHGYGVSLINVSEFTPDGLPHFLVKDIPPKSEDPVLSIERPEIYYGERTNTYVVVNSGTEEFDYPSGDDNRYTKYKGTGGVQISGTWRKFIYGYRFDGTKFFMSEYPDKKSRIMFHRQIRERVSILAPFLTFDADPYIVIVDGRLYWIVDGYTTSDRYPYSEPFSTTEQIETRDGRPVKELQNTMGGKLGGINYIRNSVKAVIDAYSGEVRFYVFEPDDPLIMVYEKIFPGMFVDRKDMGEALGSHVRYPADLLLVQGLVYAKYHMTDPAVFYNQEDLWVRATEKYYSAVQPVEPYYIMWDPPGGEGQEFVLMLPFTPKKRQVLIGWIAGMCDGGDYGRFLAYQFPKDKRVIGTQQVESKIDQDRYLSGQLTLWDQRGSRVIRGNVLVIPIGTTIMYVEPIYLQAETAAYPEMRVVAVMHGDRLSYADTFGEALEGLVNGGKEPAGPVAGKKTGGPTIPSLIADADSAFKDYIKAIGDKRFKDAADALERLQKALEDLTAISGSD